MYWIKKIGIAVCNIVIILAAFQYLSTQLDEYNYPPPGKLVDVGGYKLHIHTTGKGGPTVVLDSGLRCSSLDWVLVQPEIAKFTQVCSYDRAGSGWSEESPLPRTSENIIDELHTLLKNARLAPPYIIVGHSFGGMNARLYASKYPDEVLGLILVDSPHEDLLYQCPPQPNQSALEDLLVHPNLVALSAYLGIPRLLQYVPQTNIVPGIINENLQGVYRAKISTSKFAKTVSEELMRLEESIHQLKTSDKNLKDIPLVVIVAGKCIESSQTGIPQDWLDEVYRLHLILQDDLVSRSTRGKKLIAENSDHMVPFYQPDIIVKATHNIVKIHRSVPQKNYIGGSH